MPDNTVVPDNIASTPPLTPVLPPSPARPSWRHLLLILAALLIVAGAGYLIFNSLTHQPAAPAPAPEEPKISLHCPSVKKFCQEGQELVKDGQIEGIGAKIEANSPVLAAFDGTTVVRGYTLANEDSFTHLSLISNQGDLTAIYYFTKGSTKEGLVKKGQVIATNSGQLMKPFNNYNLMFLLLDKDHKPIPKERIIFELN